MVMRLGTSCARLVQAVGTISIGLLCTSPVWASDSDYGADYTDDFPVAMHAEAPSPRPAPASAPPTPRPSRVTAPLSLGDEAIGVQSVAPNQSGVPARGMSQQSVRQAYGAPLSVHEPIGQPPITRWDYPAFRVYFEYDHVIHSVIPERPEPIDHSAQLD